MRGPFKVLRHSGDTYFMYDSNTRKEIEANISTLHPFHFQADYVDPTDVARRDVLTSFIVESVLQHTGDKTRRSTLDFLVKFLGYGDEFNLWLPYSEMRDNVKCHEYLIANNMKNLLPRTKVTTPKAKVTNEADNQKTVTARKGPKPKSALRRSTRAKT